MIRYFVGLSVLFLAVIFQISIFDINHSYPYHAKWINQYNIRNEDVNQNYKNVYSTLITPNNKDVMNLWNLDILDGTLDGKYSTDYTGKNSKVILIDSYVEPHEDYNDRIIHLNPNNKIRDLKIESKIGSKTELKIDLNIATHGAQCIGNIVGRIHGIAKDAKVYYYTLKKKQNIRR